MTRCNCALCSSRWKDRLIGALFVLLLLNVLQIASAVVVFLR